MSPGCAQTSQCPRGLPAWESGLQTMPCSRARGGCLRSKGTVPEATRPIPVPGASHVCPKLASSSADETPALVPCEIYRPTATKRPRPRGPPRRPGSCALTLPPAHGSWGSTIARGHGKTAWAKTFSWRIFVQPEAGDSPRLLRQPCKQQLLKGELA